LTRTAGWRALRIALLAAAVLGACAHAIGVLPLRFVTQLDLAIADSRLRAFMPRTLDPRIVIVDIDERSLAEIGRWPWGRDRMAALADELFVRQRAAVVGFDVLFAEPDTTSGLPALERILGADAELARLLERPLAQLRPQLDHDARFARTLAGRNAVLGFYLSSEPGAQRSGVLPAPLFDAAVLAGRPITFTRWRGFASNLPVFAQAAPAAGFFNAVPDPDGQVRSVPLIAELDGRHYEPLALAVLRRYTGVSEVVPVAPAQSWLPGSYGGLDRVELRQGNERLAIPVDAQARARVPFRGAGGARGGSFEYVAAADLLSGRVAAGHLAGKLVLVGSTAPGVYDMRATPVAEVFPGVEVHANLLSGLLDARIPGEPDWASGFELAQLVAVAVLLIGLLPRLRAIRSAQLLIGLLVALVAGNLWAYRGLGLILPLASALLLALLLYMGLTVWAYIVEGRNRRSLARLFGTYVPPELVEEMARDPARYDMRAENRVLTIMFCDMRNFTRVSEQLAPEDVRALVNRFFSAMTGAIRAQRGTLDKYIGDAIMAFWGAPVADAGHASHAVRAALAMTRQVATLNAELQQRGLPPIGVGIGLNSGLVCVGDMGSNIRRSYTVMGDAVNLASRIEALTRHYGVDLLVGESTRDACVDPALCWIEVDRVRVKGKAQPVTLFTPVTEDVSLIPTFEEQLRHWLLALTHYRLQHWDEAQAELRQLRPERPDSVFPGLRRLLDERITEHRSTPPPADWDGAHTFDSK
jgi:adenylate cyclase